MQRCLSDRALYRSFGLRELKSYVGGAECEVGVCLGVLGDLLHEIGEIG
jgi:hypothetical protein